MTTMTTIEVESLDESLLDGTLPCEIFLFAFIRCGRPASHRIKGTCAVHGHGTAFICADCLRAGGSYGLYHSGCDIPVEIVYL
jgi:hypothetical protein